MSEKGVDLLWTVRVGALYRLEVESPDGGQPFEPVLSIRDDAERPVAQTDADGDLHRAQIQRAFEAGVYRVNVHDYLRQVVRGGAPFRLDIAEVLVPECLQPPKRDVASLKQL